MFNLDINIEPVRHYPYRTAQVIDQVFSLRCDSNTEQDPTYIILLQSYQMWGKMLGINIAQNHSVIELRTGYGAGKPIYFSFSDHRLTMGLTVVEREW